MKHGVLLITGFCLLAFSCQRSSDNRGQEWTRFRGPNGSGVGTAASIPLKWSLKDCNWRAKLPGVGHSSPVIWDDMLFVTSTLEEDGTQIIRCLRTSDGQLIWEKSFASTTYYTDEFNTYATVSPTVDAQRVYMKWTSPEHFIVVALDRKTGGQIWRRDLGPSVAEHGLGGASPILVGESVILANDQDGKSSVVALNRTTGKTVWNALRKSKKAAYATPCVYRPKGAKPQIILSSWVNGVSSVDPSSGKLNWEMPVFEFRVVGSPIVADGLIFASCGSGGGGNRTVAIRPGVPEKGTKPEIAYEIEKARPYVVTPVANGQLVFLWADCGIVTCIGAPTGKVHWRKRIGGKYFGSPVCVLDRLYCIDRDGTLVVLAARDKYKLLAKIDLGEPSFATPAIANGAMYLRTLSHLMAIGGQ